MGETGSERALLILVLLLVLVVELINSAVEAAVDRFGGEQHTLSGNAKDTASAAVFVAIVSAIIVWGVVLLA
jgi:diacylglycerol kinase (ATP)